jgi:membrane-bound metal-dependent hydrolase YbcI (DUF457 family)
MFIGHFGLGFAAKRAAPHVSLAVLFLAAQFADALWPFLVAAGVEQVRIDPGNTAVTPLDFVSYPWSHSLLMLAVWGALLGWIFRATDRRAFAVIAALVLSHWVLDFVTHRPDMPLYPGGPEVGLGLWRSMPLTAAVELPLYLAGVWIYARATRSRGAKGRWAFASLWIGLLLLHVVNLVGPPPPSITAIWAGGIVGFAVIMAWSWWADRHRTAI